jgi:hypothetical protein
VATGPALRLVGVGADDRETLQPYYTAVIDRYLPGKLLW